MRRPPVLWSDGRLRAFASCSSWQHAITKYVDDYNARIIKSLQRQNALMRAALAGEKDAIEKVREEIEWYPARRVKAKGAAA